MPDHALILPFDGKAPKIHDSAFVAPGARIIGDVEIGPNASIWYNCVLRGDINRIVVGAGSNLQDATIVHVEGPRPDFVGLPTLIAEGVLIGHGSILHGCRITTGAFVGMGSVVMDDCEIGAEAMLAAGAMLTPGKRLPSREVWAGRPARKMREIGDEEAAAMANQTLHYVENSRRHRIALEGSHGAQA